MNKTELIKKYADYYNNDIGENEKKMTYADAERRIDKLCGFLEKAFESGEEIKIRGYIKLFTKILKGREYITGKTRSVHKVSDHLVPRCEFGSILIDIVRNR